MGSFGRPDSRRRNISAWERDVELLLCGIERRLESLLGKAVDVVAEAGKVALEESEELSFARYQTSCR